jgi:uncharacterized OB-fold protein
MAAPWRGRQSPSGETSDRSRAEQRRLARGRVSCLQCPHPRARNAVELRDSLLHVDTHDRLRLSRVDRRLVGARCRSCGAAAWPSRAVCHVCGSIDVGEVLLEPTGTLVTFTTVWVSRPGLEAPYTLGQVMLDDHVGLFAHVRGLPDDARVPLRVRLSVAPSEADVPPFWFEPADPGEGRA